MRLHPLTNCKIPKYYQSKPRFNGVYLRDNIGTHWVALYVQNNIVTCFDIFGVEHIPKEIKTFISNKSIKTSFFRIQACDSIMWRYFCIGFIDFMLAGKTLTDFTNLFSPNNFKKNDDIIFKLFYD